MSTSTLKQVILVRTDISTTNELQTAIAKAPLSLVTRVFDNAKSFIGRSEAKVLQEMIIEWIDNCDQRIEIYSVDDVELLNTYEWTAEIMGIPTQTLKNKNQEDIVLVIGPGKVEDIDSFISDLEEYNPQNPH